MAQIIKEIRVDVSQPCTLQAILAKQYDCNSRFLKITLTDCGTKINVSSTSKVTINTNRPDGQSKSFNGTANTDGTVTVPLPQWSLSVVGMLICDVSVTDTSKNERLTTMDIFVDVKEAANDNTNVSENPSGEITVITPTKKIDKNSTDNEYPSAKAVYDLDNITSTASGKAITVESANAPLQNLKVFGKTEQDGVLGENVLPYPYYYSSQTICGVTFTDLGDGRIKVKGTAPTDEAALFYLCKKGSISGLVKGKEYRLTGVDFATTGISYAIGCNQLNGSVQTSLNLRNGDTFEATNTSLTNVLAVLIVADGATVDCTIQPKIEVASVDLVSVGDSGSFEVGVYGGNLLSYPYVLTGSVTTAGVTYTDNGDGTITANGKATVNSGITLCQIKLPKGTYTVKYNDIWYGFFLIVDVDQQKELAYPTNTGGAFTLEKETTIKVWLYVAKDTTVNNVVCKPILCAGEKVLPYEPYKAKQSLTLTNILRGVGDIADEKDFARGVTVQRFDIVDLGTLTWGKDYEDGIIGSKSLVGIVQPNKNTWDLPNALCSAYATDTADNVWNSVNDKKISISPGGYIRIRDNSITDYTTLGDQMSGKYLVYQLATPIETPLTETELNAYRHLMTNKGTTTVLSEAEAEVDYYINKPNAQAIGNIHSQVNEDYFKLQQAIISLGGN